MPMSRNKLYEKLLYELDRCPAVDEGTRAYWLANYSRLPVSAVTMFYEGLVKENAKIDELIAAGTDADPALAGQIINKGRDAKIKLLHFEEAEARTDEDAERYLKQNL